MLNLIMDWIQPATIAMEMNNNDNPGCPRGGRDIPVGINDPARIP